MAKVWIERGTTAARGGKLRVRFRNPDGTKNSGILCNDTIEAEEWKKHIERRLAEGRPPLLPTEFVEYAEEVVLGRPIAESSKGRYLEYIRFNVAPRFRGRAMGSITQAECRTLIGEYVKAGKVGTAQMVLWLLGFVFKAAVVDGLAAANVVEGIEPPKKERDPSRIQPLEPKVIEDLADGMEGRFRLAVLLGGYAGLRAGECGALMDDAVDRKAQELKVYRNVRRGTARVRKDGQRLWLGPPKSRASIRSIPLEDWLLEEIDGHIDAYGLASDGRLFRTGRDGLVDAGILGEALAIPKAVLGVSDISFHTLRHTFASLLIQAGAHPKVVQSLMGHSTIAVTMDQYGHLFPGMGRELMGKLGTVRADARRKRLRAV